MTLEHFQHLRRRLPFPVMQVHCKKHMLPTALGWDKLEEKLHELSQTEESKQQEIVEKLDTIFRESITIGHRAVLVCQPELKVTKKIASYFSELQAEQSDYLDVFPYPLSQSELSKVSDGVFLCEIRKKSNAVTLVFCTKRLIEHREPRTRSEIGDKAIIEFGWQDYEEFVLIKREYIQCYEIIRVDSENNLIEFRIEEQTGINTDESINELKSKVNALLSEVFEDNEKLTPINLFPAIYPIYSTPTEGIVVELGFTTETGSAKHEKMRLSGGDLRTEQFHVGGKTAIKGALTPFKIGVRWLDDESRVHEEVMLPGSIRQLGRSEPYLDYMILKGSLTDSAMCKCIERVVKYLQ